jgi:uncharacterized membrane protein
MKTFFRWLLAAFMTFTGTMHFVRPQPFVDIVLSFLPYPLALVYISGFFEVLFGVGLLIPRFSRHAAWGLIALYIAVFPANVNMAVNQLPFMGTVYPVGNWLRLPFQLVLILWAYWLTKRDGGKLD